VDGQSQNNCEPMRWHVELLPSLRVVNVKFPILCVVLDTPVLL
jgi:hypothetical protein